ncbi:MAG: NAD(P)-binding domain-containing protein [Planctomycetota bacterium]|mgnify:CR=1 FL=1|nr:NAD(P)-binding domain-containing protein [Planctomycetota bacterium]
MPNVIQRYAQWLHLRWPAGEVEKLPIVDEHGATNVKGIYVVGDLTGIPLLKFSSDTGARAVKHIAEDPEFARERKSDAGDLQDIVIIGAGVSGMAAAIEAKKRGLRATLFEASEAFSTVVNFPKAKPIYTYPTEMTPFGDLQFTAQVKEPLLDEMRAQVERAGVKPTLGRVESVKRSGGVLEVALADAEPVRARRVIVAIGRSGNFRKLGVPGEEKGKVFNRLHDPKEFAGKKALVVGGGDSALETAIALAQCGASVTLSYRKPEFARPKPENVERLEMLRADPTADVEVSTPSSERVTTAVGAFMGERAKTGSIALELASKVRSIDDDSVSIVDAKGSEKKLENDVVFSMIGREAPLAFFRKSGVAIHGERSVRWFAALVLLLAAAFFVYHWKKSGVYFGIGEAVQRHGWFPYRVPEWWASLGGVFADKTTLIGTLKISLGEPGFYYSFAYCVAVSLFGWRRIRRRKTPYVKVQTLTLALVQIVPLFLLPYAILPWMGNVGLFDHGVLGRFADEFMPKADYGHGREYWRAFGFVLAWPLFFWNVFTDQPMWGWLIVSLVQTFVIIPAIVWKWGKGAYCGWICSCGALAETLGDTQRTKMSHGKFSNRLNFVGQAFLLFSFVLLFARSLGWAFPNGPFGRVFQYLLHDLPVFNYVWFVDLFWAGILGVGLYWHFSGRVWCRFACPLAALMHVYARFSRFRIIAEKKKCISCNVCTSVCHQGIDVMNFANKGLPMADPQCVRCSACVQSCPTGVLQFGEVDTASGAVLRTDSLAASPVLMAEARSAD